MGELQLTRVHAPDVEQTVDASSDAQVYGAWLGELLRASIRWQVVDDVEVGYVEARVGTVEMQEGLERRVLLPAGDEEDTDDLVDPTQPLGHRTIFVGNPALRDVRALLEKQGFRCAFENGILVCNETVCVKKTSGESGGFVVEGPLCSDYYLVRQIVYGRFKML